MLKFLKPLFDRRDALPPHVHFHTDETGQRVFCDESICRPAYEPPALGHALFGHPVR
jgi:hypothetical protein